MEGKELMEALGLEDETPSVEGVKKQEVADPADEESENNQTVAESGVSEDSDIAPNEEDGRKNAIYAAARRKAEGEAKAALEKEKTAMKESMAAEIRALGVRDPKTGKLAESVEELRSIRQNRDEAASMRAMERAGIKPEFFNDMIENHPAVKEARELSAALKAERDKAQSDANHAAIEAEIKKISAMDPSIKSFDDLYTKAEYGEVYEYATKHGLPLHKAYILATHDASLDRAREQAKRQTFNDMASKKHMTSVKGGTDNQTTIPPDELLAMKELVPGLSEKEYADFYRKQKG